uniref:Uncharacterized protein n=1 Tax=Rhizophora mucronata TaxID=61149 RepID=A0A2P2PLM2_RHIMU
MRREKAFTIQQHTYECKRQRCHKIFRISLNKGLVTWESKANSD